MKQIKVIPYIFVIQYLFSATFTGQVTDTDGNPLENFHFLYAFGGMDFRDNEITHRGGVRWTIKGGVVFDNQKLIEEVITIVKESKENWANPVPKLFMPMNK